MNGKPSWVSIAGAAVLCLICAAPVPGATGIPVPEMADCDTLVEDFLQDRGIPGATVAIAKDGRLVSMRAFGTADVGGVVPTRPNHRFRIASISKPITAVAVMKLWEDGALQLDDTVFGPGGILENHPYLSQVVYTDARIDDIRVDQLINHSAGWDRDIWCFPIPTPPYSDGFLGCDPIVAPLHVSDTLGETNPVSKVALIRFLMEHGLDFTPGTDYAYSNIGYLVLGEIVKTVSGMPCREYVRSTILEPLQLCDIDLGNNFRADKLEREGEYVASDTGYLACDGNGTAESNAYGYMNIEAMDAHGGWISSARDLVRFLVAVDGFSTRPDILAADTLVEMTTPSANNANYAPGWSVNSLDNWWHTGSLPGTGSVFVRTSGGYTWAVILNNRSDNSDAFFTALDELPWDCVLGTTTFPDHDLMDLPTVNPGDLAFSDVTGTSLTLSWTPGDGTGRLLVGRKNAPIDRYPNDGVLYAANATWGLGANLGNNTFVLAAGNGTQATVTGLDPGARYYFRLFEFNRSSNTGNHPLYQFCGGSEIDVFVDNGPGSLSAPLLVGKSPNVPGDLVLSWGDDCAAEAQDFGIYEGALGFWRSHSAIDCEDEGINPLAERITPAPGNRYYLVVPNAAGFEGSYGTRSDGVERSRGQSTCEPDWTLGACP